MSWYYFYGESMDEKDTDDSIDKNDIDDDIEKIYESIINPTKKDDK